MDTNISNLNANHRQLQQLVLRLIEGIVLLDKKGNITWANEAALRMHGCNDLDALGTTVSAYARHFTLHYLNHHAVKTAQYPMARAVAGDSFSAVRVAVSRRGARAESLRRVHEARSVMLTNARGNTESFAVVLTDVTEEISAEARFERTFSTNPAPAVIYRPADNTYIKANRGFLRMTGFERDQIISKQLHEVNVLQGAPQRDQIMIALQERRAITQQESSFQTKEGAEKSVIIAGQPIEVGADACMILTFIDLDERKRAEASLRESEARFATAFQLAPVPMIACERSDWRVIMANAAFTDATGYDQRRIIDRDVAELDLWEDAQTLRTLRERLRNGLSIRAREAVLRTADGMAMDCLISAEPVNINERASVLCAIQDITDRKRSEMELVAAIEAVMKDASWFTHTIMEKLAQMRNPDVSTQKSELSVLTPREKEILTLICEGKSNVDISTALQLSPNTVRNHIATVYDKIDIHQRGAAVVWGRERGLVSY